jgi:hypothetical protein
MHRATVSLALVLLGSSIGSTILAAQTASQSQPSQSQSGAIVLKPGNAPATTAPDGSAVWTTQTLSQKDMQAAINRMSALGSCPVSLHAQQSAAATRREVGNADSRPQGVAQSLHLTVTNPDSRVVVAANVTVRGFADKGRMVGVLSTQGSSDAAKTLDVHFPAGSGKQVSANLRVPGLTAVSAIDLNSVTYADGSVWKLASASSCRSWIDGFMLVGNH